MVLGCAPQLAVQAPPPMSTDRQIHARVAHVLGGEYVGLEEVGDDVWDVYFGPLRLGQLDERKGTIEDALGRRARNRVSPHRIGRSSLRTVAEWESHSQRPLLPTTTVPPEPTPTEIYRITVANLGYARPLSPIAVILHTRVGSWIRDAGLGTCGVSGREALQPDPCGPLEHPRDSAH
jgi:hypothetical protein